MKPISHQPSKVHGTLTSNHLLPIEIRTQLPSHILPLFPLLGLLFLQKPCLLRTSEGMHWREARASEMSIRGALLLLLLKGSVHCQGTCREFTHSVFTRAPQPSLSILCLCPRTPMTLRSTAPFQAGMFIGLIMSRFVVCSARGRGRSTLMVV